MHTKMLSAYVKATTYVAAKNVVTKLVLSQSAHLSKQHLLTKKRKTRLSSSVSNLA